MYSGQRLYEKEMKEMAANVESMFSVREKPWHGLGTIVKEAPTSADAIRLAGLDWSVVQEPIYTNFNRVVDGYRANVRSSDRKVLGVVSDRYKVVQNVDAFSFTDELLGKGVRYETAGSLQEGKKVWLLARLLREYIIAGERISPYLVFSNTHDGSGSVKVAITPVRVVCNNTLNLALGTAKRSFSMIHTGNIQDKIQEAKDTLFMAEEYMDCLGVEFEQLRRQKITDAQVKEYIELLLPMEKEPTPIQSKNIIRLREDMMKRYYDAPDLQKVGNNAYRFINAVSDFATHSNPLRRTANYNENLFARTVDGNPLIDRAYQMVKAA
jgi:phage/plasmid-like protein (TIGR03299 family)